METRHRKKSREITNEKKINLKRRGPGRPPIIKKRSEVTKQVKKDKDSKNKQNLDTELNEDEPERINMNEPIDVQSTLDFQFPPEIPTEEFDFPNISKSGIFLDQFQRKIADKFCDNYFSGNSLLFSDETNWIKLSIISFFIQKLKIMIPNLPPVLIITTTPYQMRWYKSLNDWITTNRIFIFESNSSTLQESVNIYPISEPVKFDIMITCREQFIANASLLPKIMWSGIIIDDLSIVKAPLSTLIPPLNKITYHFSIVITADFNSMKITDLSAVQEIIKCPNLPAGKTPTIELFHSIIDPFVIRVTSRDVSSNDSFQARLVMCPMTPQQHKQYVQVFDACKEEMSENELRAVVSDLKGASTHPHLVESGIETGGDSGKSGKTIVLSKLLNQQKLLGRSVAIICSSMKSVSLLHSAFDHQIPHAKIDSGARSSQIAKLVQQFNNASGFAAIIVPCQALQKVLPELNADTIVAFDVDWSPLNSPAEVVKWIGRVMLSPPELFVMITKDSFEQFLFEHLWRNRSEDVDDIDPDILESIVKMSAKTASDSIEPVRGTSWAAVLLKEAPIINFADTSLFGEEPEQTTDEIWPKKSPPHSKASEKVQPSSKPLSATQFWSVDNLVELASLLDNFGLNNWGKFESLGRTSAEVMKVAAVLLKHILADVPKDDQEAESNIKQPGKKVDEYENIHEFLSEFSSSDLHRLSLPAVQETIKTKLNPLMLLYDIEINCHLHKIVPDDLLKSDNPSSDLSGISLEGKSSPPLGSDWNDQSDRELLLNSAKFGMMNIPADFYPEYKDNLIDRVRNIVSEIVKYDREISSQSTVITLPKPRIFTIDDHRKIINALMDFGFPSIGQFVKNIDIPRPYPDSVNRYVNNVLKYCAASVDDRRAILPFLAEKIQKYNTAKIPQRVQLFQQIRESVFKYREFPAEDIEFLSAIASHGFMNYSVSPILNCACFGHCSEIKLFTRIKQIFLVKHRNRYTQAFPDDLRQILPLKLNDMQMLTEIGQITGFHSSDYIYPLNYQCATVASNPAHPDVQIWILCTIREKEVEREVPKEVEGEVEIDAKKDETEKVPEKVVRKIKIPWFVVEPKGGKDFLFEGESPDAAFEEFRAKMAKKSGRFVPPFDGHEMFGLNSALVHRILIDLPGYEKCEKYQRRFFRSCFPLISKWPIIGQFEKEPEKQQNQQPTIQAKKFKLENKNRLVLDFSPLFSQGKSDTVIDLRIPGVNCAEMADNYSLWMKNNNDSEK